MPGMNLTREEAARRAQLLHVSAYQIALDLSVGAEVFRSQTTANFSCSEPGASTFIDLVSADVSSITLNGTSLDPKVVADGCRITLPELAAENTLEVIANCRYMNTGEGLHRFVDPVDNEVYLYTQFEVADARRVFCVFDQPDLKATFSFQITAPQHWTVVSNQPTPAPVAQSPDVARWDFAPTPRLASYVTAVIAGPYHVERGELTSSDGRTIPLGVFCRASLSEHLDAADIMDVTRAGFEYFERQFELPYPFEKYDQLFVPEFNAGAMENAGAVTFVEAYIFRSKVPQAYVERRALTVLHELAHMWFGDLVTMRWWDDLWLNESFAEWASTACQAENTRWPWAWTTFSTAEKAWAYRQDQLPTTHPIAADIRDLEDVEVNFDGITYAKGASVLKQLVAYVGLPEFISGLRRYFKAHAWGNTELADLLRELELASGRDLKQWSAQWLQQAGVNTLTPVVEVDASGCFTSVEIHQSAPESHPILRIHRLAIGCYDVTSGVLRRVEYFELDVSGAVTAVPELIGRTQPDLLLINDEDLAYAKIRLDQRSLATAAEVATFESSMPRALVLGAAWDMLRDAESTAHSFVELGLKSFATEADSTVLRTLLGQVGTAVRLYSDPARRPALSLHWADQLFALAEAAAPGSDQQLQLTQASAAVAQSAPQVDLISRLLSGEVTWDGLSVDTDMRWSLLTSLVVAGAAGEEQIAAELARDQTANGQRAAALARAAIGTPAAKEAAWASVVDADDLPNAIQESVISGFSRVQNPEVLRPFVQRYFAALLDVWATRTNEIAQQLVVGLFPTVLADAELLTAADSWLSDNSQAPAALIRLVRENRDGVARALRVQAADTPPIPA